MSADPDMMSARSGSGSVGVGGMGGMAAMGMGIPIMGVSIDGSKRGLDDPEDTGRDGKRGRFEVIE